MEEVGRWVMERGNKRRQLRRLSREGDEQEERRLYEGC